MLYTIKILKHVDEQLENCRQNIVSTFMYIFFEYLLHIYLASIPFLILQRITGTRFRNWFFPVSELLSLPFNPFCQTITASVNSFLYPLPFLFHTHLFDISLSDMLLPCFGSPYCIADQVLLLGL